MLLVRHLGLAVGLGLDLEMASESTRHSLSMHDFVSYALLVLILAAVVMEVIA